MKRFILPALLLVAACGPAPQPVAPAAPAPTPSASAPAAPKKLAYARDQDGLAASYDGERNPFAKLIIAKLWIATAALEDGESSERMRLAKQALEQSNAALESEKDLCVPAARATKEWAEGTKQGFERRYLAAVELLGEDNLDTKVIDKQVTVLRDEIESLEQRMKKCPKSYFGN